MTPNQSENERGGFKMFVILTIVSVSAFAVAAVICNIRDHRREGNVSEIKKETEIVHIEKKAA